MARRLVWVRSPRNANAVSGAATDLTNVQSLRAESAYLVGATAAHSVDGAFTLKRLLMWWQFTYTTLATLQHTPYGFVAARVGNSREFVEWGTDNAFLNSSGPQSDLDADWLMWNPVMAGAVSKGTPPQFIGRGFIDNRSQRRCEEVGEDIFVFSQVQAFDAADLTVLAMSWAALVALD